MIKLLSTFVTGIALAAMPFAATAQTRAEKGEAQLTKMLEGRVAGDPVNCIPSINNNNLEVIEGVGFVYDAGNTIYVARASNPRSLSRDDIIVIRRFGSQICAQDIIHTVDRMAGFTTGVVFLEDFVPYTRQQG